LFYEGSFFIFRTKFDSAYTAVLLLWFENLINIFIIEPIFNFLFINIVELLHLIFVNGFFEHFFLYIFEEIGVLFVLVFTIYGSFLLCLKNRGLKNYIKYSSGIALVHCLSYSFVNSSKSDDAHESISSFLAVDRVSE
jgi:hypothetical protein